MLLAEGSFTDPDTIARFINQVGFPISLLTLAAVVILIFLWKYAPTYRENAKAQTKLFNTISEHHPQVTATLERLADKSSDIFDSQLDIALAISAASSPDARPNADAHLARVFRRDTERKKSVHPQFKQNGQPNPNPEPEQKTNGEREDG
jgi:hypothetical protein